MGAPGSGGATVAAPAGHLCEKGVEQKGTKRGRASGNSRPLC
jgi:hypothetical protein